VSGQLPNLNHAAHDYGDSQFRSSQETHSKQDLVADDGNKYRTPLSVPLDLGGIKFKWA
jgi:hypothetical protein